MWKIRVATMSKDIWHTKDEIPRQESRVLWKSGNVVCGGRFDTYYKCFCGPASQFVDLKRVSRWAYIDDLLALETGNKDLSDKIGKLKTELERTRKALDYAIGVIQTVAKMSDKLSREYGETLVEQLDNIQAYCWQEGYVLTHEEDLKKALTALEQKE